MTKGVYSGRFGAGNFGCSKAVRRGPTGRGDSEAPPPPYLGGARDPAARASQRALVSNRRLPVSVRRYRVVSGRGGVGQDAYRKQQRGGTALLHARPSLGARTGRGMAGGSRAP